MEYKIKRGVSILAFTRLRFNGDTYRLTPKSSKNVMGYLTVWKNGSESFTRKTPKTITLTQVEMYERFFNNMYYKEFKKYVKTVYQYMEDPNFYICNCCGEIDLKRYELMFDSNFCCECYFTKYHGFNHNVFPKLFDTRIYDP